MTAKPRLKYYDVIKGIAIFLVVMGHVLTMCIREIDQAFLFKMIGEVHMPLFFFISGYFTFKAVENRSFIMPRIWQRFKQLIIPFLVVGALWVVYFPHSGLQSPLKTGFDGFILDVWKNGYWFTLCLFEIILVYCATTPLLSKTNKIVNQIAVAFTTWGVMGAITFALPEPIADATGLPLVFQFYPVFMAGVIAKSRHEQFVMMASKTGTFTASLIFAAITLYIVCYSWEFSWLNEIGKYIMRCILHITLAIVVINIVKNWTENANDRNRAIGIFSYLGKESLSIYLLHYFVLFPMGFMQEPLRAMGLGIAPTATIATITASIIIAITLLINHIIGRSKILALLLTGKN